jgi:hypothetical protein
VADVIGERCPVCWGSHACGHPRGHDGKHACIEDGEIDHEIDRDGVDEGGFQWAIYTIHQCDHWWPGGNCERHEDHAGPHHGGRSWYDDDGNQVNPPDVTQRRLS